MAQRPKKSANPAFMKGLLADNRLTQQMVADRMGLDKSAVNRRLNGKRGVRLEELGEFARMCHVPPEDLFRAVGVQLPGGAAVAGWVDARGDVQPPARDDPKTVTPPPGLGNECLALRFRTRGYMDGWLGFYVPGAAQEAECLGRVCVVNLAGSTSAVKVLSRGYEPNSGNLIPFGPDGQAFENVRIKGATPILWFRT